MDLCENVGLAVAISAVEVIVGLAFIDTSDTTGRNVETGFKLIDDGLSTGGKAVVCALQARTPNRPFGALQPVPFNPC